MIRIILTIDLSDPMQLAPGIQATAPPAHVVTLLRCVAWSRDLKTDRIEHNFCFRLSSPAPDETP